MASVLLFDVLTSCYVCVCVCVECVCSGWVTSSSYLLIPLFPCTSHYPLTPTQTWNPQLSDDELLMYLRAARSIALHAGVCMTGMLADGYLVIN